MVFLEGLARPLLVLHAILGAAVVAVSTHLAVWTHKALFGHRRLAGLRWLAAVGLGLFSTQFVLGNLIYPAYKVRVRAEYFDQPRAVAEERKGRETARAEAAAKAGHGDEVTPVEAPSFLPRLARLFDLKEHLAALALPLAAAACALAFAWQPDRDGRFAGRLLYACALTLAATTWLAAIVGLLVSSYRSIGS
jgi:hypothetical protein